MEALLLQIIRSKNRIPPEILVRRLSELEQSLLSHSPKTDDVPNEPQKSVESVPHLPEPTIDKTPLPAPVIALTRLSIPGFAIGG